MRLCNNVFPPAKERLLPKNNYVHQQVMDSVPDKLNQVRSGHQGLEARVNYPRSRLTLVAASGSAHLSSSF